MEAKLALVVPCYNEEEVLPETSKRLIKKYRTLIESKLIAADSEIYFVDDGSKDNTWSLIETLSQNQACIRGIKLSRNRGHQNALLAGMMTVDADVVISIDADLQDDIDIFDQMLERFYQGCEIVYAARNARDKDTKFKRWTAEAYYSLMRKLGVDLVFNHADYRLLSRTAIEALRKFDEVNIFIRGMIPLLGYKTDTVYYERGERFAGESKYPLSKMLFFAIEGITSFSNVPLRLITYLGLGVSVLAFLMVFWVISVKLFTSTAVPGWASIVVPMLFLGGVQLICLGVIGEYLGKIYMETKGRPKFIVEKLI